MLLVQQQRRLFILIRYRVRLLFFSTLLEFTIDAKYAWNFLSAVRSFFFLFAEKDFFFLFSVPMD